MPAHAQHGTLTTQPIFIHPFLVITHSTPLRSRGREQWEAMAPLGVGDCVAIADLLIKAVKVLKESGGAAEEYQDVEEHAIALNVGLGHLRTLEQDPAHQTPAAFSQALSLCEKSLQQLCQKKAKYEPSLGKHAKVNKLSGAFRKMQWALLHSKDAKNLRAALSSEMISAVLVLQAQLM